MQLNVPRLEIPIKVNLSDEERSALSSHIEDGYLQALGPRRRSRGFRK
jgi:hypothetical protein